MIEGKELHNLLSEIIGYKLIVKKNGMFVYTNVVKTYPMFYIDDMYNLRDYLDKENLGVYRYEKIEDKQDEYFERLLKRHSDNLEYEQTNPPIWYGTEKDRRKYEKQYSGSYSSKSKRKRAKQQDINFSDMPKKQTVAEKKLAARVAKINALSFKIKPQN